MGGIFIPLSVEEWINRFFTAVVQDYGSYFQAVSDFVLAWALLPLEQGLRALPAWTILALVAVLAWLGTRRVITTLALVGLLYLIGCFGLWDKLLQTLAIMLLSTFLTIVIGLPVGIWMSRSRWLKVLLAPVLDMMQTLPTFVYMIPVLMLFGLGKVPAIIATVIYALPPLVRLTDLGIRQVPSDMIEAGQAFGCTRSQLLIRVQLPLARHSIMAGINQSIMMALAMVVIASMIGARGLGEDVLAGINNLDIGKGMQAGLAIVILAIVIDRISQSFGRSKRERRIKSGYGS
ncbi:proline/glycine betaine ABC transporter permease [Pseudomonas sp. P115]|uniref:ABC transporter permease n=1 Tax=Pseudomonas pisciculturae TaxID=2730413 RepID=UPI001892693F|nr:proline/glycine betaine ABC transporter permease [Pseudomonas pisciculturae]MBF6029807.1 proline/glycine betaine ABC transporter permease [Pseudomonas pisciculturae]